MNENATNPNLNQAIEQPYNLRYAWWVVFVLMLAYVFSFVDRYVINLLAEQMKRDMGFSDTQLSILMGASFALFYATLGIPIGRLADTKVRKNIIAIGITIWSVMTAFSGLAKNYWHFLLARIGVGVGEAALSPSAYSMLTDLFPKNRLATAISVYSLGVFLGSGLAFLIGGAVIDYFKEVDKIALPFFGDIFAWQMVFFVVGIPGLLLAVVIYLLREPLRCGVKTDLHQPIGEALQYIWKEKKQFVWFCFGAGFFYVTVYAVTTWMPAYLERIHGLETSFISQLMGIGSIALPAFGAIVGGRIADSWTSKGVVNAKIRLCLIATLLFLPTTVIYTFMPTTNSTLWALLPYGLLVSATIGVAAAAVQEMMPNQMRGLGAALLLFTQNFMGLGLGPTSVALLNDYVFMDAMAIETSLVIVSVTSLLLGAFCYWKALWVNDK